jgi:hypothetical protein
VGKDRVEMVNLVVVHWKEYLLAFVAVVNGELTSIQGRGCC